MAPYAAFPRVPPSKPLWMRTTLLAVTPGRSGRIRRAYVETLRAHALALDAQRSMQDALPCTPALTLDSDHPPSFSRPEELARCLPPLAAHRQPMAANWA